VVGRSKHHEQIYAFGSLVPAAVVASESTKCFFTYYTAECIKHQWGVSVHPIWEKPPRQNQHITSMGIALVKIPHAASIHFVLALLSKVYVHHKTSAGYKKRVSWLKNNAGVVLYEYVRDAWTSWHHTATSVMQPESMFARYRQYSTAYEPDWLRSSALNSTE